MKKKFQKGGVIYGKPNNTGFIHDGESVINRRHLKCSHPNDKFIKIINEIQTIDVEYEDVTPKELPQC